MAVVAPNLSIRLLTELAEKWPERRALLGCDFTQSSETILEAQLKALPGLIGERKAEFILVVFPNQQTSLPKHKPGQQEHSRPVPVENRPGNSIRGPSQGPSKVPGPPRRRRYD